MERKRPRESFTKTLAGIAEKVSANRVYEHEWRVPWLDGTFSASFSVSSLWVAGSWARGAAECSDLDLVADVKLIKGNDLPDQSTVKRLAIGKAPHVSLHIGLPEENSSGVAFEEARRIGNFWE